jgi:phage baseplate assembly protein W
MAISGVVGVNWPWNKFPVFIENADVIETAIHDIIFTALGERKMNSAFGSQTLALVFENKGEMLQSLAKREISIALAQHLPSIEVLNIDVEEPEKDTDPVTITVTYRYLGVVGTTSLAVPTL